MFGEIRDFLPMILIPSAWVVTHFTIIGYISGNAIGVAHIVMLIFITVFLLTGFRDMREGALRGWLIVLVVGLIITTIGTIGFVSSEYGNLLRAVSVYGWMIIPTIGIGYTGYCTEESTYYLSMFVSAVGIGVVPYISAEVSVLIVGLGHTIAIGKAVVSESK